MMSLAEVKERVTELSQQERADLQAFLLSLEVEELSPQWLTEIERRRADFHSGKVKFLTHDEVFASTRVKE